MAESLTPTMDELDAAIPLKEIVESLYGTFRSYKPGRAIKESRDWVCETLITTINSAPLRGLTSDALDSYVWKAMTSWGTVDDFKHFLPRLLEIFVVDADFWHEQEKYVLFGKLDYAKVHEWPGRERDAVRSLIASWWRFELNQFNESDFDEMYDNRIDDILSALGGVLDHATPLLSYWQAQQQANPLRHMARCVLINSESICRTNQRWNIWYENAVRFESQIVEWFGSSEVEQALRDGLSRFGSEPFADEIVQAIDAVEKIHQSNTETYLDPG